MRHARLRQCECPGRWGGGGGGTRWGGGGGVPGAENWTLKRGTKKIYFWKDWYPKRWFVVGGWEKVGGGGGDSVGGGARGWKLDPKKRDQKDLFLERLVSQKMVCCWWMRKSPLKKFVFNLQRVKKGGKNGGTYVSPNIEGVPSPSPKTVDSPNMVSQKIYRAIVCTQFVQCNDGGAGDKCMFM